MMTVSVCVVALNEEQFLPSLLDDIRQQTFPHEEIEIVLVDSASTDRTREIMDTFQAETEGFWHVEVLDNAKRRQSCGWNIAIAHAAGDVIIRLDAHSRIPKNFVMVNMQCIASGENICGGARPCVAMGDDPWIKTLLQAENSRFGTGGSACRVGTGKKYVKTLFHAAYRREVFQTVGGFNEHLNRTEDNELHYRMGKAGYRLRFVPEIISWQYARTSLPRLLEQKRLNGYWIGATLPICPRCLSVTHFVPGAFVGALVIGAVLAFCGLWQPLAALAAAYLLLACWATVQSAAQSGVTKYTLLLPWIFLLIHIWYGVGTWCGLLDLSGWRRRLRQSRTEEGLPVKLALKAVEEPSVRAEHEPFSVLMSLYFKEQEEYVRQCFDSLLSQTVPADEWVIIEDGLLTDGLYRLLDEYETAHPGLIRRFALEKNQGLGKALSEGIPLCRYELIARMDTDDICLPDRFEKQLAMFRKNPSLDICGGHILEFDRTPDKILSARRVPLAQEEIAEYQKRRDAFNHMTVMYRKSAVLRAGNYQSALLMEDSLLWVNMLLSGAVCANVNDFLVYVRTGNDMYDRRGGVEYFRKYCAGRRRIYETGYISRLDYLYTIAVQMIVALIPCNWRRWIYVRMLRDNGSG